MRAAANVPAVPRTPLSGATASFTSVLVGRAARSQPLLENSQVLGWALEARMPPEACVSLDIHHITTTDPAVASGKGFASHLEWLIQRWEELQSRAGGDTG